jgi:hypothetical protein
MELYADYKINCVVPPAPSVNISQASPRGIKRSRSPEPHSEGLYDRADEGKLFSALPTGIAYLKVIIFHYFFVLFFIY